MRKIRPILVCVVGAAALLGGCASQHQHQRLVHDGYESVSPSLVTPSDALGELAGSRLDEPDWEFGRSNPPLRTPVLSYGIAEIRHWETLRTTNARPREYTTTRSRSIRWFQSP